MHPLTRKMHWAAPAILLLIVNFPPLQVSTETRWAFWFVALGMAIPSIFDHLVRKVSLWKSARS